MAEKSLVDGTDGFLAPTGYRHQGPPTR